MESFCVNYILFLGTDYSGEGRESSLKFSLLLSLGGMEPPI